MSEDGNKNGGGRWKSLTIIQKLLGILGGLVAFIAGLISINVISYEGLNRGYIRITGIQKEVIYDSLVTFKAVQKYTLDQDWIVFNEVPRPSEDWDWQLFDEDGNKIDSLSNSRIYEITKRPPGNYTLVLYSLLKTDGEYENKRRKKFEILPRKPKVDFTINNKSTDRVTEIVGKKIILDATSKLKYQTKFFWDLGILGDFSNQWQVSLQDLEPGSYPIYLQAYNEKNQVTSVRKLLIISSALGDDSEQKTTEEERDVEPVYPVPTNIGPELSDKLSQFSLSQSIEDLTFFERKIIRLLRNNDSYVNGPNMPLSAYLINIKMTYSPERNLDFFLSNIKWANDSSIVELRITENQ